MRLFATQSRYADRLAAAVCEKLFSFQLIIFFLCTVIIATLLQVVVDASFMCILLLTWLNLEES